MNEEEIDAEIANPPMVQGDDKPHMSLARALECVLQVLNYNTELTMGQAIAIRMAARALFKRAADRALWRIRKRKSRAMERTGGTPVPPVDATERVPPMSPEVEREIAATVARMNGEDVE